MNSWIWTFLGIEPTTDIAKIKNAYAAQAKLCHPEEHPEEFQRLQAAYRQAVRLAKGQTEYAEAEIREERAPEIQVEVREEAGQDSPVFSYEDVTDFYQEETVNRFFLEFGQIARTPYLQNRKVMWSYFLFQADYEDLYHHEGFRRRLIEEICAIPGWSREVLDAFAWWLSLYQTGGEREIPQAGAGQKKERAGKEADLRRETGSRRWRWKRFWSRFSVLLPEHVVSDEMRMRHYLILQNMRDRGLNDRLLTVASVEGYWRYYKDFLRDNEGWLGLQYKVSRRKRRAYWAAIGGFVALVSTVLILELGVFPYFSARQKAELARQRAEELSALLKEQQRLEEEGWGQELEQRFQQLEEQYQDWMNGE